ncbi:MAG: hypothetical protein M1840_003250 [Geoglossum simile]|nr:MAG: hypothetical protein M1840_003250 [Geoglossum simile]
MIRNQTAVSCGVMVSRGPEKTVLSSLVIDNLKGIFAEQNVAVAFFYPDYRDRDNQSPANVVASLLKLVASLEPTLPYPNTLLLTCQEFRQAYIIIDALDRCAVGDHRKLFLQILGDITKTSVRLFATSRPHPDDIKRSLGASPRIAIEASDSDIRKYLAQKIDQDGDIDLIDEQLKEEIIRNIASVAQGMFLLPALQIRTVLDQTTRTKVRRALKAMPKDLYGISEKTLYRIKQQPESRAKLGIKTLMWISHARRTIMVRELHQALAVSSESTCLDKEDCTLPKFMVDCCFGLVVIDEESSTIRLVHFSVQGYLPSQWKELFPLGEQTVTETCLVPLIR